MRVSRLPEGSELVEPGLGRLGRKGWRPEAFWLAL